MGSMQGRKFTLTLHVDYTSIDPKLTAFRHFRVLASKGLLTLYSCTCDAVEMVNFLNGTAERRVRLCGFSGGSDDDDEVYCNFHAMSDG
nr:hypothetical protein Itr_chr05CG20920 [Ipomoea trifida]